jgi:leucyl-tRNA synthetase
MKYNPNEIEAKWQKHWAENQIFAAENNSEKPIIITIIDWFHF